MAQPTWLAKYLRMKPEVTQIYEDLEAWHDHCRFNLLKFDPADLYKSHEYKAWVEKTKRKESRQRQYYPQNRNSR